MATAYYNRRAYLAFPADLWNAGVLYTSEFAAAAIAGASLLPAAAFFMAAAIAVPLLIRQYGGDPAVICAIGMLAGFCGTLMTPMAANFNIVPAALLELKDRNAVVRAQIGTALPLLVVNTLFIWWFAF
jgi:uncharacterized membrane protein